MEHGPFIDRYEKIELDTGETPSALLSRPVLVLASHAMILQCFMTLHMMRKSNGFSPNPITLREIIDYQEMFGRLPIDKDLLLMIVKQCDEAALERLREKSKPKEIGDGDSAPR